MRHISDIGWLFIAVMVCAIFAAAASVGVQRSQDQCRIAMKDKTADEIKAICK